MRALRNRPLMPLPDCLGRYGQAATPGRKINSSGASGTTPGPSIARTQRPCHNTDVTIDTKLDGSCCDPHDPTHCRITELPTYHDSQTPRRRSLLASPVCQAGAQAQTEIQWWHSMGGALGEWVNDLSQGFNASQKDLQDRAHLQGQLRRVDDGRDRRLPGRQRAAHPAGVRGRHGHHDGQQGRDRAGGRGHENGRREVRPETPMCPPWPVTTRRPTARC